MTDPVSSDADVTLQLGLTADDGLTFADVKNTLSDLDALLRSIEAQLTNRPAHATWEWSDVEVDLGLVARPNGVDAATLRDVVTIAYQGFVRAEVAAETGASAEWPPSLPPAAQRRLTNILGRLRRLTQISVEATDHPRLEITEAHAGTVVRGRRARRVYSAVDGELLMLSAGDRVIRAALREHRTRSYVRCVFDADRWEADLLALWRTRVLVEGMVLYDERDRPRSINGIRYVAPRQSAGSLADLAETADLTNGVPTDDFVDLLRGSS